MKLEKIAACLLPPLIAASLILSSCNPSPPNEAPGAAEVTDTEMSAPPDFPMDALSWGMSQQEVLEALRLEESEVVRSQRTIPEGDKFSSRTLTEMRCRKYSFEGVPIVVIFTFVVENTQPQWDLGFSRLRIDVESEDTAPSSKLKQIFESTSLNRTLNADALTVSQKDILQDYCAAAYPGTTGGPYEMMGIRPMGGIILNQDYYSVSYDGEYPAVWNRYVMPPS